MRVTVTGATGRIGTRIVQRLRERGDDVTVLSRDPGKAHAVLGAEAVAWDPGAAPAPAGALAGRDGVIHLAGEDVAQRWDAGTKRRLMGLGHRIYKTYDPRAAQLNEHARIVAERSSNTKWYNIAQRIDIREPGPEIVVLDGHPPVDREA